MLYTAADLFDLAQTEHAALFEGCEFPWQALPRLADYVRATVRPHQAHRTIGHAFIGEQVSLGEGTVVEAGAMIVGPAIIGRNCQIRHNAYVRENVVLGDGCVIGNACEVKNALLFNGAAVPHFNYVGDSILGHKAHLGAGAVLSNLKLNGETVWIEMDGRCLDTGLRKFGALVGDRAEVGCNAVLNPGSILGPGALVYPNVAWRGILPAHAIAKNRAPVEVCVRRPRGVLGAE
jgi:UDP-N-acetylglucosamine diphosphorylase / glucose-1-phosphate thymidylyltransferase / UDP-N-acetylgalactosamine diphosphorylase / glucosamine-1-phosphate N-acetyltransferase / galactosamine-1-phosphate N-acetyltransferase